MSKRPKLPRRGPGADVRLVATDLDGTLLTADGTVSERTRRAVRGAREAGIHVIPATGRPPKSVWDLASTAGLGPVGVCANGAAAVDLECSKVISTDAMDPAEAHEIVEIVRSVAPSARFAADDLERFSHESTFFEVVVDWEEEIAVVTDISMALGNGIIQLIARRPGWSAGSFIRLLEPVIGDRVQLTTSGLDWIYLGRPRVTKASQLAVLCAGLGIGPAEVIAVGDHYNDLSMLTWAGTAMAVANAVPDVLAIADLVLPSNTDHGVAALLEELVAAS